MSTSTLLQSHPEGFSRWIPLKAGTVYFACVFAVGFVLGPIREFWIIPRLGLVPALLLESGVMLSVSVGLAQWILRHFAVPKRTESRVIMGSIAFGLLQVAEAIVAYLWRGQDPLQFITWFRSVPGFITLVVQAIFGVIPALL